MGAAQEPLVWKGSPQEINRAEVVTEEPRLLTYLGGLTHDEVLYLKLEGRPHE